MENIGKRPLIDSKEKNEEGDGDDQQKDHRFFIDAEAASINVLPEQTPLLLHCDSDDSITGGEACRRVQAHPQIDCLTLGCKSAFVPQFIDHPMD